MMDLPWIAGAVGFIIFFVIFEAYAFNHPERTNSLSRFVYNVGSKFPLSIFLLGGLCFGLAVHFYWHWCPPGSNSFGLLQMFDFG